MLLVVVLISISTAIGCADAWRHGGWLIDQSADMTMTGTAQTNSDAINGY